MLVVLFDFEPRIPGQGNVDRAAGLFKRAHVHIIYAGGKQEEEGERIVFFIDVAFTECI